MMRILGIDPGLAITGYGIIQQTGNDTILVDYGTLTSWAEDPTAVRLASLKNQLIELIENFSPDHLAIEQLFFNKNTQTALSVGMSCGVILSTAAERHLSVFEYTPLQVKQALTGYGRASKQQIQYMVKSLTGLASIPKPDDAADAVAIALCHAHSLPMRNQIEMAVRSS